MWLSLPGAQATLRRNPTPDPRFDPAAVSAALSGLQFQPGSLALFLGRQYYGCVATVLPGVSAGLDKKVGAPHKWLLQKGEHC